MNLKKYFGVSKDFIYTIIATIISTGTMQLLVYPRLASTYSDAEYGMILTILAAVNVITLSVGSGLFYARLIENEKYVEKKIKGDFSILLVVAIIASAVISGAVVLIMWDLKFLTEILVVLLVVVTVVKTYAAVAFRIVLNFKKNLISNIISAIGYGVGVVAMHFTKIWPLAFIFAEVFAILYMTFASDIFKEPFKRTVLFKNSLKSYVCLFASHLILNLVTYLDRFIINPMLGEASVSVYYAATFFAKTLSFLVGPISGVLLGYMAKNTFKLTKKKFLLLNAGALAMTVVFWGITMLLGRPITAWLYPTLIDEALPILWIASLGTIVGISCTITMLPVMKYAPPYWQTILSVVSLALYFACGYISLINGSLLTFSYACLIYNCIRMLITFVVGWIYMKPRQNEETPKELNEEVQEQDSEIKNQADCKE